ncbi:threonine/serine dehydratase [Nitrospinota bacterium]
MQEPTYQDVLDARERIRPYLPPTPFHEIPPLSEKFGCRFFLKFESMQPTGAFKVRGGVNLVSQLPPEERERGLITASTGNHGGSIAWAARAFGVRATVAAPEGSNPDKLTAIRRMGAEVVLAGKDFDEAREWCEVKADERGLRYIHSANEPRLIAGVATAVLECLEEAADLDVLIVPIGGGSGAAGAGLAAKTMNPRIHLVGVQAENAPAVHQSLRAGRMLPYPSSATFADGLATRVPFELTFGMMQRLVDETLLVAEKEMCEAIRLLVSDVGVIAEGAGAAPTAAAAKMDLRGKKVAAILSGRNLTAENLRIILSGGVPRP